MNMHIAHKINKIHTLACKFIAVAYNIAAFLILIPCLMICSQRFFKGSLQYSVAKWKSSTKTGKSQSLQQRILFFSRKYTYTNQEHLQLVNQLRLCIDTEEKPYIQCSYLDRFLKH